MKHPYFAGLAKCNFVKIKYFNDNKFPERSGQAVPTKSDHDFHCLPFHNDEQCFHLPSCRLSFLG